MEPRRRGRARRAERAADLFRRARDAHECVHLPCCAHALITCFVLRWDGPPKCARARARVVLIEQKRPMGRGGAGHPQRGLTAIGAVCSLEMSTRTIAGALSQPPGIVWMPVATVFHPGLRSRPVSGNSASHVDPW